jgi:hypothetical protein
MHIIRLPERATRIAQGEADLVPFIDQLIEILRFPECRPFIVVPELDVVAPADGCIFDYQTEIPVLKPVFVYYLAVHILFSKYVQKRHCAQGKRKASIKRFRRKALSVGRSRAINQCKQALAGLMTALSPFQR